MNFVAKLKGSGLMAFQVRGTWSTRYCRSIEDWNDGRISDLVVVAISGLGLEESQVRKESSIEMVAVLRVCTLVKDLQ